MPAAAFTKAADYFDVELVRVPVDADFRVRADALADACTDETIMVVGSAPTYPHGVIDPIADIAALALERGILCHVDACMGGFLLPFLTELGRMDEPFDFRVAGVTSMSADVHKYGYASKGVSVILYRTHELARLQLFVTTDWLGGFYASTAMAGTRPAGPVAAAWAALMYIGHDGYLELTRTAHDRLRAGVESIDGLAAATRRPRAGLGADDPDARHLRRGRASGSRGLVPGPAEPPRLAPRHGARRQCGDGARAGERPAARSGSRDKAPRHDTTYGQT